MARGPDVAQAFSIGCQTPQVRTATIWGSFEDVVTEEMDVVFTHARLFELSNNFSSNLDLVSISLNLILAIVHNVFLIFEIYPKLTTKLNQVKREIWPVNELMDINKS